MLNNISRLNEIGYKILDELADSSPDIFLEGDTENLRSLIEERASKEGDSPYRSESIQLEVPLNPLNQLEQAGPDTDAYYAPLVRQAVSGISPAQATEDSFWASINCFALSPYIPVRWGTSKLKQGNLKNTAFVKRHWLWQGTTSRTWNAAARLWWLAELATRASEYSKNSVETLLDAMGNNVGLYHQLTSRTYLAANPQVVAAIYDVALDGSRHLFEKTYANLLMKALNMRAGNISFDVFDYDELYEIVESCLPPKERGATD